MRDNRKEAVDSRQSLSFSCHRMFGFMEKPLDNVNEGYEDGEKD